MKHIIFFIVFSSIYSIQGMFSDPLTEIEKHIVMHKVQRLGKATCLNMIQQKKDYQDISCEAQCFPTITKIYKNQIDDFALLIINSIKEQESIHGYVPKQISEKKDGGACHIIIPNNYFGNYTHYWHKQDDKGEYIELHSIFTYKPSLLEVVNNCSDNA
jgi:hypothetical protein